MSDVNFWPSWPGKGKFAAVLTILGIIAGTYLFGLVRERARLVRDTTLASTVSTD